MGLPRAIKAHAENLLVEAEIHYRRAYDQGKANDQPNSGRDGGDKT